MDQLIAMGENLIQMKSSTDMQKLEGLTDASANAKSEPDHNLDTKNLECGQYIRYTGIMGPFVNNGHLNPLPNFRKTLLM